MKKLKDKKQVVNELIKTIHEIELHKNALIQLEVYLNHLRRDNATLIEEIITKLGGSK